MRYYWHNRDEWPGSLNGMYEVVGMSKQGFHGHLKRYQKRKDSQANLLLIIHQIRSDHPTMCCRYMYAKIKPDFMGRDRFEDMCREEGLMIGRKRSKRRTTDSTGVIRFENLLKDTLVRRINQVWSSDITYFELNGRFYYLTFILDCYSRRIIGHQVSDRLYTSCTTLPALRRALRTRNHCIPENLIFHSDGGGQYYESEFLKLTTRYKMQNSMCKYAYENDKAERINGVIKNNYLHHRTIGSYKELTREVDRAVRLYNTDKPHSSLGMLTPVEFENKIAKLTVQNPSTEPESFDANNQINRASSPILSGQNPSLESDVIYAN